MSTQSMADPENFGAVISRCRINDNDITKYDNPSSLEVWDVVATNSNASGYMIDIRPGTDDPLSHQLVYNSELHLSVNGSPTPYVLNGSFVNLSTFNAVSGGGNTNLNPNFVDPANGDFTIVIQVPVLGTLAPDRDWETNEPFNTRSRTSVYAQM